MTLPKVIVPIVASTEEEAIEQAKKIREKKPDIVELRLDHLWKGQMELPFEN
jgi:3-dehydroquinate dehydratase